MSNIQGYAATTVSEHTCAMILGLPRNLFQYRAEVIEGAWQDAQLSGYYENLGVEAPVSLRTKPAVYRRDCGMRRECGMFFTP